MAERDHGNKRDHAEQTGKARPRKPFESPPIAQGHEPGEDIGGPQDHRDDPPAVFTP